MKKKSEVEMERSKLIRASRMAATLRSAIQRDEYLNDTLPDLIARFDDAVSNGELLKLDIGMLEIVSGDASTQ